MSTRIRLHKNQIINATGKTVKNPAVLIQRSTGFILIIGEQQAVQARYDCLIHAYRRTHNESMAKNILFLDLSRLHIKQRHKCYILKRLVEYDTKDFIQSLEHMLQSARPIDPVCWIESQMLMFPIDLEI